MRWSLIAKWIATGFLFTAFFRFAFGHPEPKHESPALPPAAALEARTAQPAPPAAAPAAAPSGGASFLSLIEVGPAEIEPAAPAPAKSSAPAAPAAAGSATSTAQDEADRRAKRRQDRQTIRAVSSALHMALESCSKQQLARNPRITGDIEIEVTVVPQPGTDRGRLQELTIDPQRIFIPLFVGCVRSAMGSAIFPSPVVQVSLSTTHTLEPDAVEPDADDGGDEDEDASDEPSEGDGKPR